MAKSFKYFRIQIGGKVGQSKANDLDKPVYRHSLYMQSRDSTWISRNSKDEDEAHAINEEEDLPE